MNEVETICHICKDEDDKLTKYNKVITACNHAFHFRCLNKVHKNNDGDMLCPLCRGLVRTDRLYSFNYHCGEKNTEYVAKLMDYLSLFAVNEDNEYKVSVPRSVGNKFFSNITKMIRKINLYEHHSDYNPYEVEISDDEE